MLVTQNQVRLASVGPCVCACRHVLSGEAAMTQQHTASVHTCAPRLRVCGHRQRLWPPRGRGKRLGLTQLLTGTGRPQASCDFAALLTCQTVSVGCKLPITERRGKVPAGASVSRRDFAAWARRHLPLGPPTCPSPQVQGPASPPLWPGLPEAGGATVTPPSPHPSVPGWPSSNICTQASP